MSRAEGVNALTVLDDIESSSSLLRKAQDFSVSYDLLRDLRAKLAEVNYLVAWSARSECKSIEEWKKREPDAPGALLGRDVRG